MYKPAGYKNKVKKILNYLSSKERTIAELLYGLNNNDPMSKNEIIQKLFVSPSYIDYVERIVEEKIIMHLNISQRNTIYSYAENDFYVVEKVDKEKLKLIFKMSDAFFNFFKGVDPLVVEEKMKILSKKQKDIICLYYGLDGIHCLDYDDLAVEYNLTIEKIDNIISQGIIKLKRELNPPITWKKEKIPSPKKSSKYMALSKKYGKEKLEEFISYLDKDKQEQLMFIIFEAKSNHEIAEKYDITHKKASEYLSKILRTIDYALDGFKDNTEKEKFYSKFKNCTIDQINNALDSLSLRDEFVVKSYFGINKDRMTIPEIAKAVYIDEEKVIFLLSKSRQKILNRLKKEQETKQII